MVSVIVPLGGVAMFAIVFAVVRLWGILMGMLMSVVFRGMT